MSENTKFDPGIRKDPWQSGLWISFISFLREIETVLPLEAFIRNEDFTKMFNGKQQNWGITRFLLWFLSSRSLYLFSLSGQELIFFLGILQLYTFIYAAMYVLFIPWAYPFITLGKNQ